jgi:hypothetical protein
MGTAAQAEDLNRQLRVRRAAIDARLETDQARLVSTIREVARAWMSEATVERVREVGEAMDCAELCDVLDDLQRLADAERTRLRAVAVHEHLREPQRRAEVLQKRFEEASSRAEKYRCELERLDIDAFRWLKDRNHRRARKLTQSERLMRAITFARLREQRAEAALRESLGHAGFDSAAEAYDRAEKGLRRSEDEAQRVAHTRAFILDLVEEHADLQERVRTEPARRLRSMQSALEARLITCDLSRIVPRAPEEFRAQLAEAHAIEVRIRGWQDLEAALDQANSELESITARAWTTDNPAALAAELAELMPLPETVDRVVSVLAAFHDFEEWRSALGAHEAPNCWTLLSGPGADCVPRDLLKRLVPRLVARSVCSAPVAAAS